MEGPMHFIDLLELRNVLNNNINFVLFHNISKFTI
jgi:hypothetical protein